MGYQAQSAEKFYHYAFRLDDQARSLTDRSTFSIVFVNDGSDRCIKFLERYFVDLCHRTSKRGRFVFFSGLDIDAGNRLLSRAIPGAWENTFIGWTLRSMRSRLKRPALDPGSDDWGSLGPRGLVRVTNPDRVKQKLDLWRENESVVYGVEEAMLFAQKLGIGHHTPCFVIITDIGEWRCHVLPFPETDRQGSHVYQQLKGWIDEYYALNRDALARCEQIEAAITALSEKARMSLNELSKWRDKGDIKWRGLKQLRATFNDLLEPKPKAHREWRTLQRDLQKFEHQSDAFRKSLDEVNDQLRRLELSSDLCSVSNPEAIQKGFCSIRGCLRDADPPAIRELVRESVSRLDHLEKALKDAIPKNAIRSWWWRAVRQKPGLKDFRVEAESWEALAKARDADMAGRAYCALLAALRALPISTPPDSAAARAMDAIARVYGIDDSTTAAWAQKTVTYKRTLVQYWNRLQADTRKLWSSAEVEKLTADVVLPHGENEAVDSERFPKHPAAPELSQVLEERAMVARSALQEEYQRVAIACRDGFFEEVWKRSVCNLEFEWALLHLMLQQALSSACREIENELRILEDHPLRKTDSDMPIEEELHQLLDRYAAEIDDVRLPWTHSERVQEIPGDVRVRLGSLTATTRPPLGNSALAKQVAQETTRDAGLVDEKWQEAFPTPPSFTPGSRLADALLGTIQPERLEKILPRGLKGDLQHRLKESLMAVADGKPSLLEELDLSELSAVCGFLEKSPTDCAPHRLREEVIQSILSAIGADQQPGPFGSTAMSALLVQVETECISLDEDGLRSSGNKVRIRLEYYLKQFISFYGPLALSPDELNESVDSSLALLCQWTRLLIEKPDPQSSGCGNDKSWVAVSTHIQKAREDTTWWAGLRTVLSELPKRANDYSHNIIIERRQMQTEEIRKSLRQFVNIAKHLVEHLNTKSLYPICLKFRSMKRDDMYGVRLEFESDPPREPCEVVVFSHGQLERNWDWLRCCLVMFPFSNPSRVDPLIRPAIAGPGKRSKKGTFNNSRITP